MQHIVTPGPGALNAAYNAAAPGDTLQLQSGDYAEDLWIFKPLTIAAAPGPSKPRLLTPPTKQIGLWAQAAINVSGIEVVGGSVYCAAVEPSGAGSTFTNCGFRDSLTDHLFKLKPGADGCTIQSCTFTRTLPYTGVSPGVLNGIDQVNCDHTLVADCVFTNVIGTGIVFKGGSVGCQALRNTIVGCYMGLLIGGITGPEFVLDAPTDDPGMYDSVDCVAADNVVVNASIAGIGLYGSLRPVLQRNTLLNVWEGILFRPNDTQVGGVRTQLPNVGWTITDNEIWVQQGSPRWPLMLDVLGWDGGSMTMARNRYGHVGAKTMICDASTRLWPTLKVVTLAQWAAQTGQEAGSVDMTAPQAVPSPIPTPAGGVP